MDNEGEDNSVSMTSHNGKRKRTYAQRWCFSYRVIPDLEDDIPKSSPILISKKKSLAPSINCDDVQKLLHIHELILNFKHKEFDLYSSLVPYNAIGFGISKKRELLHSINSCLVSLRYQEAAKLLELLALEKKGKDHIFYYGTFKILNNSPNVSSSQVEMFIRSCLFLNKLNKKEVLLDFITYKMQKNDMELPKELHHNVLRIRNKLRKNYTIDNLYTAYMLLYDYISWAKLRASRDLDDSESLRLKEAFVSGLADVISQEGMWDIFILKIREMLEYYDELDECEEILESHLYANQENLNSHVYLYDFLRKYNRSKEKQKLALENIVKISPSDELALDYFELLISENDNEKAINVLLEFLEYPHNKENIVAWEEIARLSFTALENSDETVLNVLSKRWKLLSSYWPLYHFDVHTIDISSKEKAKCITFKCVFLLIVARKYNDDLSYIEMAKVLMESDQPKSYKALMKKLIKIENLLAS